MVQVCGGDGEFIVPRGECAAGDWEVRGAGCG